MVLDGTFYKIFITVLICILDNGLIVRNILGGYQPLTPYTIVKNLEY